MSRGHISGTDSGPGLTKYAIRHGLTTADRGRG